MGRLSFSPGIKTILLLFLTLIFITNSFSQFSNETFPYNENGLPDLGMTANEANWGSKIFADSKKNIWIYGFMGLKKYSSLNITRSDCENHLQKKLTSSICEDKSGNIIVGSNSTMYIYDGNAWTEKKVKGNITAMCSDENGVVWLCCRGLMAGSTLYKYEGQEIIKVAAIDGSVINIIADSTNLLLGVQHFTASGIQFYDCDDIYSLSKSTGKYKELFDPVERIRYSLSVTASYVDRTGTRWFGSKILVNLTQIRKPCLISSLNDETCLVHERDRGMEPGNMITAICQDDDNNIWVGTLNGLYRYNNNIWSRYSKDEGLTDNNIVGLVADQNNLYVYTGKALTLIKRL